MSSCCTGARRAVSLVRYWTTSLTVTRPPEPDRALRRLRAVGPAVGFPVAGAQSIHSGGWSSDSDLPGSRDGFGALTRCSPADSGFYRPVVAAVGRQHPGAVRIHASNQDLVDPHHREGRRPGESEAVPCHLLGRLHLRGEVGERSVGYGAVPCAQPYHPRTRIG